MARGEVALYFINDWCSQLANIQRLLFILISAALKSILSVFSFYRHEQSVSNFFLRYSCIAICFFYNGYKYYVHMNLSIFFYLSSALSIHRKSPPALHFTPFSPLCFTLCRHLGLFGFVCFSVFMQDPFIKFANSLFSSSLQDSHRASEAAWGGRSSGWTWGSSSYRDQRHLGQSTPLQQWSVLHEWVRASVWVCMQAHWVDVK